MNEEIMNPSWNENSGELAEMGCKFSAFLAFATFVVCVVALFLDNKRSNRLAPQHAVTSK